MTTDFDAWNKPNSTGTPQPAENSSVTGAALAAPRGGAYSRISECQTIRKPQLRERPPRNGSKLKPSRDMKVISFSFLAQPSEAKRLSHLR